MKTIILLIGVFLQGAAVYIAFFSEVSGNIYLATIVSVISICCLTVIRSLIAPVCVFAGILAGLSLSHNKLDLETLTVLEQKMIPIMEQQYEAIQDALSTSVRFDYSRADERAHLAEIAVKAVE